MVGALIMPTSVSVCSIRGAGCGRSVQGPVCFQDQASVFVADVTNQRISLSESSRSRWPQRFQGNLGTQERLLRPGNSCTRFVCRKLAALAVDTDLSSSQESSSAFFSSFQEKVGKANRDLQQLLKLNHWVVRDYFKLVEAVNSLEDLTRNLSDVELCAKTTEFRKRLKTGETRVVKS